MNLPEFYEHLFLFTTLGFDFFAIFLLVNLIITKKSLIKREQFQKQKAYQTTILKEVQDKIGYSLDIDKIAEVIITSLKNLFSYSTASSLVIKDNKLTFKVILNEPVSNNFINTVKTNMLESLKALTGEAPGEISEEIKGAPVDNVQSKPPASFFNIPLVVNTQVVGVISVSSTKANLYKEEEMTILYQITELASNALSKLQSVLDTEKGKLTAMIAGLADGVFMVDSKNELLIINDAAKKFLSLEKDSPVFLDIVSSFNNYYDVVKKIEIATSQNRIIEEKEVKIGNKVFQIFLTPVSLKGEKETIYGTSVLLHDITLEKEVANIKEDFTNMMVHDLRAPLTSIKDASQLMLNGSEKFNEEEKQQMISIVEKQSKKLLEQIGSILDAAKIESRRFSVQKTTANIQDAIAEIFDEFKPIAIKRNVSFTCNLPQEPLPEFEFDRERIEQVISNLVANSLKFTSEGGIVTISGKKTQEEIEISVSDTGIGIPKEEQQELFSKFYQIRKTPRQLAKKGTGLGLYIVKGIIEAHKGRVWVISEEGKGTTITFTLPFFTKDEENSEASENDLNSSLTDQRRSPLQTVG